jgi:peroxiredoxin family protein
VDVIVTKGDLEKAIIAFCRDEITVSNGNETSESLADWLTIVSNKVREL